MRASKECEIVVFGDNAMFSRAFSNLTCIRTSPCRAPVRGDEYS